MRAVLAAIALAGASALRVAPPTPGPLQGIWSLSQPNFAIRHCNYYATAMAHDGTEDFDFVVAAPLNGAANAISLQSVNYPEMYLAIVNATSGHIGIGTVGADDSSWAVVAPLNGASESNAYSLRSLTTNAQWSGQYLTFGTTNTNPCAYSAPDGDIVLTNGADAARSSWLLGAPGPVATSVWTVDVGSVINPAVNKRWMGCHSDYGFAQAPRGFYANLVYGAMWDQGTCSVPSWTPHITAAGGSTGLADASSFSTLPSMGFDYPANKVADAAAPSAADAVVGMANRGLCGAGLVFEAGKPYSFETWVWTGAPVTAFAELRDFTTNTSLARVDWTATSTGPAWGSTWIRYNFTLTPTASTNCTGIPYGSDPTIDCGGNASPANVCVRCGGELVVGLSAPGSANFGYVSLMPGDWGLLQGPDGPLPVLKSGADLLTTMGVTVMRSGGSVSQSMRWKDWRGPQWNRRSVQQVWGKSLLAGWGPFEVIDACSALGIEPIITLAYDLQDAEDFADLVEYAWGDDTTSWGRRRIADGHPSVFNVTVFELGNEQVNPFFVEQVAAMEARAAAVGAPPLRYMYPQNGGVDANQAAALLNLNIPNLVERIMPDLHVGAGGAVEEAAGLFANPPVAGFNQGAINCETNANSHDHGRALAEASDLIDWFTYNTTVTDRLYARTASFCTGSSNAFDSWSQGLAFFLPNMTWLQPPGWVHAMITQTWAETTVKATLTSGPTLPFAAQRTADGKNLVLRAVTSAQTQPLQVSLQGATAAGPSYTLWTLAGSPGTDNTPSNPMAIAPQQQTVAITAGSTSLSLTLPDNAFVIAVVPLQ